MSSDVPPATARFRPAPLLVEALPGLVAVALFLAWARLSGGYFPHVWYAGGLFLAALFVVLLLVWPGGLAGGLPGATVVALAAFAGFAAWSFASIAWADVRGDAWDGANRTALYLIVFALFALWAWTPASVLTLLGAFSVGVCALGVASLVAAGRADDVGAFFHDTRFSHPIGYANGNAALFLLAFWPALFLATRRELPTLVRAPLLAVAAVLVQLAVLPQSRGAYFAFAVTLGVAFALLPDRLRVLVALAPVAVALAVVHPRLTELSGAGDAAALAERSRSAVGAIALAALAVLVAGVALAAADRAFRVPPRVTAWAGRAAVVAALLALAVGVPVALGDPRDRLSSAWDELTAAPATDFGGRVGFERGLETNRVDLWRVALGEFREQPVRGIGTENFAVAYLRERRSEEETLYPHSFPLQVLSQTGLVGTALMAVFLAAALAAALRARRRPDGLAAGAAAVTLVVFAYWLAHGAIDWFWELPALAGPALACLALAGALARPAPERGGGEGHGGRIATAALVAATVAVAVSFAFPWVAARDVRVAISAWRADPVASQAALERARTLNPLSERPDVAASVIARYRGDWDAMAAAALRALERSPTNWYAHLQLALARERQGRPEAALQQVDRALELNPSEPLLTDVRGQVERGETVDLEAVARVFRERYELRTR